MLPQRSDTNPPCLQQLTQPHPRPFPPILAFLPSPPHVSALLLPLAGRGIGVRDAEGERGSIGWRGRVLAQSSVLFGRRLVLFLLLIGRQQYLDRARLFTGGHKTGRGGCQSASSQEKKKTNNNRVALTSGELLHRGKVTTRRNKQMHTYVQTHNDAALCKHRCEDVISLPCCL